MKLMKILFPMCIVIGGITAATATAGSDFGKQDGALLPGVRKSHAGALPSSADNSRLKYLRPVFNHLGHACGFAAGIAYAFTYELDAVRDLDAKSADNQYSYIYPYHFFNDGLDSTWNDDYTLGWDIVKTNGIPNCTDQGGFEYGFPTKWVNGYDKYFKGMHNRISNYDSIDLLAADGLNKAKRWLYDHSNGSNHGGVLNFSVLCFGIQIYNVPIGTTEGGAAIITQFGSDHHHAMTIVGYNDSVRYDFNNDKKYTNNLDINNDGKIDMQDLEIGAFKVVNSWGPNAANSDSGFYYASYRLFATPDTGGLGGISRRNRVFYINILQSYSPKLTLRATITHSARNNIKIIAGVSENTEATAPAKIKNFGGLFNFAGGAYPMEGKGRSATIEIGLDITELIDSIGGKTGKYFLIIESKEEAGVVDSCALMDYTSEPARIIPSEQKAVAIASNSTLNLGIVRNASPVLQSKTAGRNYSPFIASPNPVSSAGKVRFTLPPLVADNAVLSIVTASGKVVFRTIYDKKDFNRITWDLKSHSRAPVSKGTYQARLSLRTSHTAAREYSTVIYVK
jgi:hypothetical protein